MFESRSQGLDVEQVFGQDIHMHRTYVRRRLMALAVGLAVLAVAAPAAARVVSGPDVEVVAVTYVVEPGDTLWSIASATSPGADPRAVIDAIVQTNGLQGASIQPGQALVVPAA